MRQHQHRPAIQVRQIGPADHAEWQMRLLQSPAGAGQGFEVGIVRKARARRFGDRSAVLREAYLGVIAAIDPDILHRLAAGERGEGLGCVEGFADSGDDFGFDTPVGVDGRDRQEGRA